MRYKALDALRGLAALVVVFCHCYEAIPETIRNAKPYVNFAFFSFAEFAHFSVLLFFVLSGFVLSLPYLTGKNQGYGQYVSRRICRLYPPYVFAVLVSAFLCNLLADPSFWVGSWLQPVTGRMLAEHLLMTGVGESSTALDGPIWSLIVEFRVSLIFPLLVLGVRRFGWLAVASGFLLAIVCFELNVMRGAHGYTLSEIGQDAFGTLLVTGRYLAFFMFGIIAAARLDQFRSILLRMPGTLHVAICVGAIVVHVVLVHWRWEKHVGADPIYVSFAVYLITSSLTFARFAKVLSARILVWLGEISYSLYLIHLPVLWGVLYAVHGRVSLRPSIAIALPVMFIAAHVMNRVIERPSTELGRRLARTMFTPA